MVKRQLPVGVIHICWIAPAPSMSAIVNVSPGLMMINGFTFHPLPSEAAADAALLMLSIDVPLLMSAFAPPPFAPL